MGAEYLSATTRDAIASLEQAVKPLERLHAIRAAAIALEAEAAILSAVRQALSDGTGWEQIAQAAGLKTAAAKWRWQGTDEQIAARNEAGRKRATRPSSVPTDLPGHSVSEAARQLGVTAQAVYLRISRGQLEATTVQLPDGRKYKRVFLPE